MGFVETVRNAVNSFLQGKMNNSLNGSAPFFSNRTNLGTAELKAFLKTSFHSYATTLSIGEKNTVISRSIDMLHEAIQYVDIVDDQGKELKNWLAKQILRDAKAIFGNDNFSSYIYFSILYEVCCWMKILAPIKVSDKGYAERIELLDPRRVSIQYEKDGDETIYHNWQKLESYVKTLYKPSVNRRWYGIAKFNGAIDDAILDQASRQEGIVFYKNSANPNVVFAMNKDLSPDQLEQFQNRLENRYGGLENKAKPFAANGLDQVIVIDSSQAILGGLESREYNSNMLAMSIGLDLRGLGYMRKGGSQAELHSVMNSVNAKIKRCSERLANDLRREFSELVYEMPENMYFRFVPTYVTDPQQVLDNFFKAEQRDIVTKEQVSDLVNNQ